MSVSDDARGVRFLQKRQEVPVDRAVVFPTTFSLITSIVARRFDCDLGTTKVS